MFGKPHSQTSHWTAEAPFVEVLQEIIWMPASVLRTLGVEPLLLSVLRARSYVEV